MANEFIVDSNGHCFLCLNKIRSNDLGHTSPEHSFQYLAHCLKLDMRKVFYEDGHHISPQLLDKVKKSKMKVELCQACVKLNHSFSQTYRQLEKIQMEMRSKLVLINETMLGARKDVGDILQKSLLECETIERCGGENLAAKLKIMDVLRNEILGKCLLKLGATKPRVKVQKMTLEKIRLLTERKYVPNSNLKSDLLIKTENTPPDSDIDEDHHPENDEDNNTESDSKTEKHNVDAKFNLMPAEYDNSHSASSDSKLSLRRKVTGFRCDKCNKIFSLSNNLKRHQLTMHSRSGPRYHCDKCDKRFTRSYQLQNHQLTIHMGHRFCCDKCDKSFTEQNSLKRHQLDIHVGRRFLCRFCPKTFPRSYQMTFHMNKECPGRNGRQ